MTQCLVCDHDVEPFLNFGPMPIANGFLAAEQVASEPFADLEVGFCGGCTMVQLTQLVEPEAMFHENYAFFTSSSAWMGRHFAALAADARARWLDGAEDPLVVEIGSNDGTMLGNFQEAGIRHLGIEPSANVAQAAMDRGVETWVRFFGRETADAVVEQHGRADLVLATNVLCHIPDLDGVLAGVSRLLAPGGVLVFEDPYLGDIVEKTSYDQIYDEHVFYFCLGNLKPLLARHGLEIVRAEPQGVHGGSMRYTVAHAGAHPVDPAVEDLLERERLAGLHEPETYVRFRTAVEASRDALVAELERLREAGVRVVGYGATSKSTTVTNYCGITPDLVSSITDTTPTKQGKLSPGAHVPVVPHEDFRADPPEVALLFAWNHQAEIVAKEAQWLADGGRFLVYVPRVGFVDRDAPLAATPQV